MYTTYTGERVRLRPWRDADELFSLAKRQHLVPLPVLGAFWYPRQYEAQCIEPDGFMNPGRLCGYAIECLADGQPIGLEACITLPAAPLAAEVGTTILPEYRGGGLGIEAKQLALCYLFENYPYHRVGAFTMHTHVRSRRGIELLGMRQEGCLRHAFFSEGAWVDLVYYVIFREDWEAMDYRHKIERGA